MAKNTPDIIVLKGQKSSSKSTHRVNCDIPSDLKKRMDQLGPVNWSRTVRNVLFRLVEQIEAKGGSRPTKAKAKAKPKTRKARKSK